MGGAGHHTPRVLIVGWGFIGAAVGRRLLAKGQAVTTLTRSETSRTEAGRRAGARVIVGNAADQAALRAVVGDVDHVLFALGGLSPLSTAVDPALEATSTLVPLLSLLEVLREHPQVGITYLSSGGTVYGDPVRIPVRETDPIRPISQYGVSRAAGEMYVQMYATTFGVSAQILRCANVYGPGQSHDGEQGVVAVFMHRIATGMPVIIAGDGTAVRDYIHIDDVSATVDSLIANRTEAGVLNLGSGEGHTVLEVLAAVERVVGRPAVVEFRPPPRYQVQSVVLDVTKLRSLVDHTPIAFEEGVASAHSVGGRITPRAASRIAPWMADAAQLVAE